MDAARALGTIGKEDSEAVQALISLTRGKDDDSDVRGAAAQALGTIGKEDPEAVQALISLIRDKDQISGHRR